MSRTEVPLPDLGEDAPDEATVNFFLVEAGDEIKEGDDLIELVTDKATFTVPSPVSGKVLELRVKEDGTIKVGDVIAVVDADA